MTRSHLATNEPVHRMHTAVRAGLVGATQTVTARFASTGSNLGPRFAVLLRYKDPTGNYYLCYRLAGGSSSLRISEGRQRRRDSLESGRSQEPDDYPILHARLQGRGGHHTGDGDPHVDFGRNDGIDGVGLDLRAESAGFGMGYPNARSGSAALQQASYFSATVQ